MEENEYGLLPQPAGPPPLDQERIYLQEGAFVQTDALMIKEAGGATGEAWRSTWTRALAACA